MAKSVLSVLFLILTANCGDEDCKMKCIEVGKVAATEHVCEPGTTCIADASCVSEEDVGKTIPGVCGVY
jgi:hypothetical protein